MALIDDLKNSNLGLKGSTPSKIPGSTQLSNIHVNDPRPGVGGNEQYRIKSELDLDGKKPAEYRDQAPEGASF